jgi:hypothetical protein
VCKRLNESVCEITQGAMKAGDALEIIVWNQVREKGERECVCMCMCVCVCLSLSLSCCLYPHTHVSTIMSLLPLCVY